MSDRLKVSLYTCLSITTPVCLYAHLALCPLIAQIQIVSRSTSKSVWQVCLSVSLPFYLSARPPLPACPPYTYSI